MTSLHFPFPFVFFFLFPFPLRKLILKKVKCFINANVKKIAKNIKFVIIVPMHVFRKKK